MRPPLLHGTTSRLLYIRPTRQYKLHGRHGLYAQPNEAIAHSYAIKNCAAPSSGVIRGIAYTVITPELGDWLGNLPRTERGAGGFIYEVDRRAFKESVGREWVATRKVMTVPRKTRFVTVEDCMKAGVQIFVILNTEKYTFRSPKWRRGNFYFIQQGIEDKGLIWLNAETGMNPIMPRLPGRFRVSRKSRHPGFNTAEPSPRR